MLCSPLVSGLVEGLVSGLVEAEDGVVEGGGAALYLSASNLDTYTDGLTADEFQNKLANLGYTAGDEAQFQSDLNAGNVILVSAFLAASTTYP